MSDREPMPRGLVLFPPGTPPRRRRLRLAFVALMVLVVLALIWPGYALFGGIEPMILGLPLSLAWVILWLLVVFFALIGLYRTDR